LSDVYDNLFVAVGMNLLWLLLSVPASFLIAGSFAGTFAIFGLPTSASVVLAPFFALLLPGPGSVGIHYFMNQLFKEERVEFSMYWQTLKQYWWRATVLFLLGLVVDVILVANILFYAQQTGFLKFVAILWFYAFLLWSMMLLYMNPLLVEQSDKGYRLIVRNAFLLVLDNAVPSLVILLVLAVISVLSIGIALLIALVTGAFVAATETRAVLTFLEKIRTRNATPAR
jgi:uncharacterized membrane protein YesL